MSVGFVYAWSTPATYALTDIYSAGNIKRVVQGSLVEVIAEPTRRRILDELLGGELPVTTLVQRLQQSQPTVSKHLRVLREANLVSVRVDGQRRMYQLRPEPLMELDTWLEPYRRMWRESLDKLEHELTTRRSAQDRRTKR